MTTPPLNIVRLNDAGLVRIAPAEPSLPDPLHNIEDLRPFLEKAGASIHVTGDKGDAPWAQSVLVDLVKARAWSQFIILCEALSPFTVSLALMALEEGYEVYIVCLRVRDEDALTISRLEKANATCMVFDQFLEECALGAESGGAPDDA